MIQITGGTDNTSTAIRSIMLYLLATPHAYQALQAEIDEGIRTGKISNPVTYSEEQQLPYLQVCSWTGHDFSSSPLS